MHICKHTYTYTHTCTRHDRLQWVLMDCKSALEKVLDALTDPDGSYGGRGYKNSVDIGANCHKMATRGINRKQRDRWRKKAKYYLSQGYLRDLSLANNTFVLQFTDPYM